VRQGTHQKRSKLAAEESFGMVLVLTSLHAKLFFKSVFDLPPASRHALTRFSALTRL
jgi:hypothetical protein